ncbi:MAG TPA: MarC family protein [bacterium]|jgi:multiple antibiotic resistance protein|nr:MarC family protein [bacterium]
MPIYAILRPYILSFIPLFIAMGSFDFLPMVLAMTRGMDEAKRKKAMREGAAAAGLILVTFLFIGKAVFLVLGVTDSDFLVAGGLLLLVLSIKALLLDPDKPLPAAALEFGIVPLATPLLAGPAAMATTVILLSSYGLLVTLASILLNCLVSWMILDQSPRLGRFFGERGTQALSKLSYILLASIAVMMIRHGVQMLL